MQANAWSTRLMRNGSMLNLDRVTDTLHQAGRNRFGIGLSDDSARCRWTFVGDRDAMSLAVDRVEVGDEASSHPATLQHLLPPVSEQATVSLVNRIRGLTYISVKREGPREFYPLQDPHLVSAVGPAGENAVSVLFRGQDERIARALRLPGTPPTLRAQVEARLEAFFPGGFALKVQQVPNTNAVILGIQTSPETGFLRPVHCGFGITQVLPIVIAILSTRTSGILLIENLEVHLHPSGQALMGQFLADAVQAGHQAIVETHSDHVLNGMRRSVKAGKLQADQVAIHFFRNQFSEGAQVSSLALDNAGNVDVWPEGFFDQFDKDMNYFAGWAE